MSVTLNAAVPWTARGAVLAQLDRYPPLARADARYRVTMARREMTLAAVDAALLPEGP